MKRLFFYLLVAVLSALSVVSCSMYDDTLIWEKLNDHEQRLSELETLCDKLNSDVETMQKIVEALQNNDYITSVTPIYEGDKLIGYTILFAKSGPITIYNGADGKDGADGEDGKDGNNGQDGKDGHTPVIGVKMDTDGFYYWTVDGEWLLDENGQKVRVTGNDGKDGEDGEDGADGANGEDGKDGQDGHTPTIGVKEDGDGILYWTIDGEWLLDENGNKVPVTGKDGEDGSDGASGSDGDSFFSGVDTSDPNYVVITLADGSEIKIPTWFAFENLQNTVNQINNNVQALQKIVEALQNNDFVTSVSPIYEDDEVIGYTIIFSKSGAVTIFNGQDGKDGQNGSNGQDGTNGTDGHTPVIGVRQDTDGVYYWTVDGEWLLDENGNKLRVTGRDGQDGSDGSNGSNGQDGADGHTPVIGVKQDTDGVYYWTVDGEWLLDENGNKVPTTGRDGADGSNGSDGQDGDSFFSSVDTSDSNYVIITLSDGTEIKLPTWKAFEELQNTVNQINNNVNALQQIVEALQNNDYVTSVTPIYEGGNVVGYTIIFSKSGAVSIFNGKDGQNGSNGQDGTNGTDGHTPVIGVRQDTDGVYYWTVDGEWLLDENGNKLRVTGRDGQDGSNGSNGSNGQDGADGHTPVIGVKQDTDGVYYWTVDGEWLLDENGNKVPTTGRDGSNGADGSDGQDGDSFFSSVDTSDSNYVIITLSDGTEIKLPTWKAFEDLQNTVNQINNNVNSLQQIVEALQNNDYVTSVTPIYEGGNVVGYTIIFSKSGAVSIFNGKDGLNGSNGQDGTNGTDGHTPVIGVRQDSDGVYYWTVDGEWLLDENGNKLRVTGRDGSDGSNGSNGQDGADGHTPVIGVRQDTDGVYYWTVDGEWLLDENGNKVPTTGRDGADGSNGADGSDGQDGDSFFSSVDTSDSNYVIITLSDGTEIKLPTWKAFEELQNTVNQINNNVNALQQIVEALQNNDYVTSVTPIYEGGNVVGYTIIFTKSGAVSIFNGKDGQNGSNGQDGTNGTDGHTPVIGVRQDSDGVYYWTIDGEWLLDENGNRLRVTGRDGQDGSDGSNGSNGQDGADGHTPVIGVKQDTDGVYYWTVDGEWLLDENGNKVPTTGRDGVDGSNGADGSDGQDGDSFFSSVDTSDSNYVIITLSDGTEIKLPTWKAFEELQNTVNQINNNVNALQQIVEALQNNDYVTSVTPIYEGGNVVGYTIIFSKSGAVSIFNGKDGQNGSNGQDGTNGADGHTPVIGVRQDTDGIYYWTIDGEWLLDENGSKLRVTGRDGQDGSDGSNGSNGQDGSDGHTPVIGVKQDTDGVYYWTVDGEWLLDENGNKVPTTGRDGADGSNGVDGSDGQDGDSFFSSVTENDKYISLILADGTEIILPKYPKAPVTLTLGTVTGFTATFNGTVHQKSLDLKVTVYYSTTPDLTVYKHRGSLAHTEFPTDSFVMKLKELAANTTYYYFVEIIGNGNTSYSEISSFRTTEPDSYVDWGDGENVGGEI